MLRSVKTLLGVDPTEIPRFAILGFTKLDVVRYLNNIKKFGPHGKIGTYKEIKICCFQTSWIDEAIILPLCLTDIKYIIGIGWCGGIQEDLKLGDLIIATGAVRGEGQTDYYAPKKMPAIADLELSSTLYRTAKEKHIDVRHGLLYTTASWYKEKEFANAWKNRNVLGIEMECARLFLISHLHKKKVGSIHVVSDFPLRHHLWEANWKEKKLVEATEQAVLITLDAIAQLGREFS